MADKSFGVKELNLIGDAGTPTLESLTDINLNAVTVAISTDVSIGGTCTANEFKGATGSWIIGNDGSSHYTFTGIGFTETSTNDPSLDSLFYDYVLIYILKRLILK